jgi:orotate phosphoribosyltransferase
VVVVLLLLRVEIVALSDLLQLAVAEVVNGNNHPVVVALAVAAVPLAKALQARQEQVL